MRILTSSVNTGIFSQKTFSCCEFDSEGLKTMNKVKLLVGQIIAAFLVMTGFSGTGWATQETVATFELVGGSQVTSFNKGSVVYVRVDNGGATRGSTIPSRSATATNDTDGSRITFTVYDDGTFPDNSPNDTYYWGMFTVKDKNVTSTDDTNDILALASGETATIECDLDEEDGSGIYQITADFSPSDHTKPSIASFEVNPTPFSPNGDNVQDTTSISYSLSDNISTQLAVRLEIRTASESIVKTLVDAETQNTGTGYTRIWDGTDDDGNPVSDGDYICRIIAVDDAGNSIEVTFDPIVVDTEPPQITNVSISPNPFSPNDDGIKDTTTVSFSLSGAASGENKVEVRDSSGTLVRVLDDEISPSGGQDGANTVSWDGKNEAGGVVSDGYYFVEVWAQDTAGNMESFTGKVQLDTSSPDTALQVLDNSQTHTSPFDESDLGTFPPTGLYISDVQIDGEWATSDPSGIYEVQVIISGGSYLDSFTPQNPNGDWQGWYLYWTPPVSNEVYTVLVKARDNVGNDTGSEGASTTILYGEQPPLGLVVNEINQASLEYGETTLYDISTSTQAASPSCFANKKMDTVYLEVTLNEGKILDETSTDISLSKVTKITGSNIQAEQVQGTSYIEYNEVERLVKLYFYPESSFNPEQEEHARDGLYQVKADIKDTGGGTQELSFFFVYDTTSPQPPEFNLQSFDSSTGNVTLSGTTQPDASDPQQIQVFVNGVSKAVIQAQSDGSFSIQVKLEKGTNSITLRAQDRAGNLSEFTDPLEVTCNPARLLAVTFRASKILRRGSGLSPVKLIYYLTEPARVSIRIYNLLGEIVYDWEKQVTPGSEEEWSWWGENMFGDEVNNGVYILRIQAVSSTRSEVVTKLVGILR